MIYDMSRSYRQGDLGSKHSAPEKSSVCREQRDIHFCGNTSRLPPSMPVSCESLRPGHNRLLLWQTLLGGAERLCYRLGGRPANLLKERERTTFNPTVLNKRGQHTAVDRRAALIPVQMQPLTFLELCRTTKRDRSHMYSLLTKYILLLTCVLWMVKVRNQ